MLAALWLAAVFLVAVVLDVGIIFVGPALAFVFAIWALVLTWRGLSLGWVLRADAGWALVCGLAMPMAAALFAALLSPVIRAGGWLQPWLVLQMHRRDYERVIADPHKPDVATKDRLWMSVDGAGSGRIFTFGYGGFAGIDQDIVYDPMDRPEARLRSFGNREVGCSHMQGHYYACTVS